MSAPALDDYAQAASELQHGLFRNAIEDMLNFRDINDPHLRDMLRAIVTGAEKACADAIAVRAVELAAIATMEATEP